MNNDPRIKEINSGVYDMCLSKAQEAGMTTFGYISAVFIIQAIAQDADIDDTDRLKLYKKYGNDFTSLYTYYEKLIKQHKFILT